MSGSQQLLLGGIPTAVPVDPYFYSVTSLLHGDGTNGGQNNTFLDSSSNNFTITRNGNTTQGSFSPFSQTGWSGYFNGSSDYISVADSADFTMGSGDFTIQCWVYSTANSGSDQYILGQVNSGGTAAATSFQLYKKATSNVAEAFVYAGATKVATGTAQIPVGQWTHLAMVRDGGTLRLYVNGSQDGTNATLSTTAITDSAGSFSVGRTGDYNGLYFAGYVSNVSVVKGTCLFPSGTTFTPSTTPLSTSTSGQSVLLCQANRFIDTNTATTAKTVTVGSTSSIQPFSPFNPTTAYSTSAVGGSGYFDGSGDYLSMTSGTSLGSGDFTIGCWVYLTAAPGAETPVGSSYNYYTSGQNGNFVFRVGTTNLWRSFDGQGNQASITGTYTWTLNTWMYMAWVRSGSTLTVYKDGVSLGSVTDSKTLSDSANGYVIGADRINGSIGTYLTGYLSGFRILVGTADSTVPTAPPTAIANTSLLCNFTNGAIFDNAAVADYETVGNAQISTSVKKYGTGSLAFDGSGDELTAYGTTRNLAALSGGDFTVEFWANFSTLSPPASGYACIVGMQDYSGTKGWGVWQLNQTILVFFNATGTTVTTGNVITATGTWYHIAVTRCAGSVRVYVNGTIVAGPTAVSFSDSTTTPLTVGGVSTTTGWNSNYPFNGYVDDLRISKGVCRYPYSFTPPTAEFPNIGGTVTLTADPYFDYTTLLLPGNGTNGAQNNTFLDSSTNAFTITRNGNTTQGTFSPFSQTGWGNYFDGSGDYLSVPNNAVLAYGTGDFTVEFWINRTGAVTSTDCGVIDQRNGVNGAYFMCGVDPNQQFFVYLNSAYRVGPSAATTLALGAWYHIAYVRSGTTGTLYINGTSVGSWSDNLNYATNTVLIGRHANGGGDFPGYLSNIRILKGTAQYTANFTPPTAPLTAITNTSLLTCQSNRFIDNSTNALTITPNGGVSVQAFSPFNPTASWSAATYGGSGYFDGSGDYLQAGTNANLALGSGDFTIEGWHYCTGYNGGGGLYSTINTYPSSTGLLFYIDSIGRYTIDVNGTILQPAGTAVLNAWVHWAVVRNGSTLSIYINGTSIGSVSSSTNYTDQYAVIGRTGAGTNSNLFLGYLSSTRMVKGTAVYTANFTPPTVPVTAIANTQFLCDFTNAGIYDATSKNDLETVGNAQISTTQSKFGGSSMYFDGTGDWLTIPDSPGLRIGTGDFTIEGWFYTTTTSGVRSIFYKSQSDTNGVVFVINNSSAGAANLYAGTGSGSWSLLLDAPNAITVNTWTHLAAVRYGNVWMIFSNGNLLASATNSVSATNTTEPATIGYFRSANPFEWSGYIQDFRITKGIARYTSNFIPPTTAFLTL